MVFVGSYLFSTIVLVADIDLKCQRSFPLNYIVWLAHSACMSYITCFVAIKLNTYLVLSMLLILLIVSITNAIFGMLDCNGQRRNCCRMTQLAKVGSVLLITTVIALILSPSKDLYGQHFSAMMPARVAPPKNLTRGIFVAIMASWALFIILFQEFEMIM